MLSTMASRAASSSLPATFRRLVVTKLSSDFRAASEIATLKTADVVSSMKTNQVLVKNMYAGVNASDINFSAGRYLPGKSPPLYPGFEAVGQVVAKGSDVTDLKEGDAVAHTSFGAYSEYQVVTARRLIPLPHPDPAFIPLMVSGLTASIALEQVGELGTGQTVLVTAAAGATGQFAVQLAHKAGNHVIGTCSSDTKAAFLKKLGCDRVVNYKKESLGKVLKEEYPDGLDIVYESVGGSMFQDAVDNLAVKGRVILIGFISGYKDQSGWEGSTAGTPSSAALMPQLLSMSASVRGFFLNHYAKLWAPHMMQLGGMVQAGKLSPGVDTSKAAQFVGLESVADAIDYMYEGKNMGKLVVQLHPRAKL